MSIAPRIENYTMVRRPTPASRPVAASKGRENVRRVLAWLTPREERVVRMRYGIGMNIDHTVEEVGQHFSLTCERVRQIEAKAMRKLKHPSPPRKRQSSLDKRPGTLRKPYRSR